MLFPPQSLYAALDADANEIADGQALSQPARACYCPCSGMRGLMQLHAVSAYDYIR